MRIAELVSEEDEVDSFLLSALEYAADLQTTAGSEKDTETRMNETMYVCQPVRTPANCDYPRNSRCVSLSE